jgi:hypothetical protein
MEKREFNSLKKSLQVLEVTPQALSKRLKLIGTNLAMFVVEFITSKPSGLPNPQ